MSTKIFLFNAVYFAAPLNSRSRRSADFRCFTSAARQAKLFVLSNDGTRQKQQKVKHANNKQQQPQKSK